MRPKYLTLPSSLFDMTYSLSRTHLGRAYRLMRFRRKRATCNVFTFVASHRNIERIHFSNDYRSRVTRLYLLLDLHLEIFQQSLARPQHQHFSQLFPHTPQPSTAYFAPTTFETSRIYAEMWRSSTNIVEFSRRF